MDARTLHAELDVLESQGLNWYRLMIAHALVDLEIVTVIECMMPECLYPGIPFDCSSRSLTLSIDHIIPISRDGSHEPENLRIAHFGCNSSAAHMDYESTAFGVRRDRARKRAARRLAQLGSRIDAADVDDKWLDQAMRGSWKWLESTRELQRKVYGVDYAQLTDDALADYVTWNALALTDELHEYLNEIQWKTWAKNRGEVRDRDAAVEELIDIGHFLGNLLNVHVVSDEEWELRYREKQDRNARRQQNDGYDARATKCPKCRRALDAPNATVIRNGESTGGKSSLHCRGCNTRIRDVDSGELNVCPHCKRDLEDVELGEAIDADGALLRYCLCGFILERETEITDAR